MDLFTVDVAPAFLLSPSTATPLAPFVVAVALGFALRYFGGIEEARPPAFCVYQLFCIGVALVFIGESLRIPSDALLLGGVPSIVVLRTQPLSSTILSILGLGEMTFGSGDSLPSFQVDWAAPVVAAHYMAISSSWPLFLARGLVVFERFFLGRGGTVIACSAIVASARVRGLLPEQLLKIIASWVFVSLLGPWWVGFVSIAILVLEWGNHYLNLTWPNGLFMIG